MAANRPLLNAITDEDEIVGSVSEWTGATCGVSAGDLGRLTMKARTRLAWLVFHRWTGIVAGLLIILVGITGSILVFEDELDIAFNRKLYSVPPHGQHLPLDSIVVAAEQEDSAWTTFHVSRLDDAAERSFIVTLHRDDGDEKQVFVDPYTAEVTGARSSLSSIALIRRLHGDLTLGAAGENTLGVLAILLMAMFVAALVVWWPREGQVKTTLSVKWDGGSNRVLRDLHGLHQGWK